MAAMLKLMAICCLVAAEPATAKDTDKCPDNLICASAPTTVAAGMMRSGYQGLIETDGDGDPRVSSAANGYKFDVVFYGCEAHVQCDSLQFQLAFDPDPKRGAAAVERWNKTKRFAQASLMNDGGFRLTYDVTTVGGLNERNFKDLVEWWASTVGILDKFFAEETPAPKPVK